MPNLRCLGVALPTVCALVACSTVEVNRFERVPSERVEHAFIRSDADFARYTAVMPGQVSVWTPRQDSGLGASALARLQALYDEALSAALTDDGTYTLVTSRGPGVLELQTQFIDLRATVDPSAIRALQRRYSFPLEAGRATLVVELVDATTGQVLAHIADVEEQGEYAVVIGPEMTEVNAQRALARWAAVLRAFLDEAAQDGAL